MFRASFFIIAPNWTPRFPSVGEWLKKLSYYRTAINNKKEVTIDTHNNKCPEKYTE